MDSLNCELCHAPIIEKSDLLVIDDEILGKKSCHQKCFESNLDGLISHKNELMGKMGSIAHSLPVGMVSGGSSVKVAFDAKSKKIGHYSYLSSESMVKRKLNQCLMMILTPIPAFIIWMLLSNTITILFLMFSPFITLIGIGGIYDTAVLWYGLRGFKKYFP